MVCTHPLLDTVDLLFQLRPFEPRQRAGHAVQWAEPCKGGDGPKDQPAGHRHVHRRTAGDDGGGQPAQDDGQRKSVYGLSVWYAVKR